MKQQLAKLVYNNYDDEFEEPTEEVIAWNNDDEKSEMLV